MSVLFPTGVTVTIDVCVPLDGGAVDKLFSSIADLVHDLYDDVSVSLKPYVDLVEA